MTRGESKFFGEGGAVGRGKALALGVVFLWALGRCVGAGSGDEEPVNEGIQPVSTTGHEYMVVDDQAYARGAALMQIAGYPDAIAFKDPEPVIGRFDPSDLENFFTYMPGGRMVAIDTSTIGTDKPNCVFVSPRGYEHDKVKPVPTVTPLEPRTVTSDTDAVSTALCGEINHLLATTAGE